MFACGAIEAATRAWRHVFGSKRTGLKRQAVVGLILDQARGRALIAAGCINGRMRLSDIYVCVSVVGVCYIQTCCSVRLRNVRML